MKTKKGFIAWFVMCAVVCLSAQASAVDDPNDLPELFDGSRLGTCSSTLDAQETGDGGTEIAE